MKVYSKEWSWVVSGLSMMLIAGCTTEVKSTSLFPKPEDAAVKVDMPMDKEKNKDKTKDIEGLKSVYFDLKSSKLSPDMKEVAKANADFLKKQPPFLIEITGMADQRGSVSHNKTLAERRALKVKEIYIAEGIPAERIDVKVMNTDAEACPTLDETCMKESRRADTVIEEKSLAHR